MAPSSFGGALAGALAGAVAVWVMDRVDWWMFDHEDPEARRQTERVRPGGLDPAHALANRVADAVGVELSPRQPHPAGIATHYMIGIAPAALYGAFRHRLPGIGLGRGALFGLAVFVFEDEMLNPALGLAAHPSRYPWQAHARGLVAHLVYGLVADAALRAIDGSDRRGTSGLGIADRSRLTRTGFG